MKKYILILYLIFHLSFFISPVYAVTPTPTPQEDKLLEIQNQLITNIASRVAQLKLVQKRGIIGTVTDVTNIQITVSDLHNNTRFIDVDELTKFSSPNAKETFGISDIKKGTIVGILGLYNKESRRILARFVNEITIPFITHGKVSAIDDVNFTLNITTKDNKQITVDIENLTRTYSHTPSTGYIRSGFSKITKDNNIVVAGAQDINEKNRMTATRVIFFPEIPGRVSR